MIRLAASRLFKPPYPPLRERPPYGDDRGVGPLAHTGIPTKMNPHRRAKTHIALFPIIPVSHHAAMQDAFAHGNSQIKISPLLLSRIMPFQFLHLIKMRINRKHLAAVRHSDGRDDEIG
jgi:hypothetical protein